MSDYERALEAAGHVDEIRIEIRDGQFVWRLLDDGREFFAARSGPNQVAGMLQASEMLINLEFGISRRQLCRPALN